MNYTISEIHQQPEAITHTIEREWANVERICRKINEHKINLIVICARGTSDNAATLGRYLLEYVTGIPTALAMPSLYTLYKKPLKIKNALVIGISQSGETIDVVEVLRQTRKLGALTLAITNERNSAITKIAEEVILSHAGKERSVAATKTYTTQLTALYLLAAMISRNEWLLQHLKRVPLKISELFSLEPVIQTRVERYRYMDKCVILGRGLNYPTALETALKLKETCYVTAEAYSSADFLHGPVAIVEPGIPVIVFAPDGPTVEGQRELVDKMLKRQAELIIMTPDKKLLKQAKLPLPVPKDIHFLVAPLTYIMIGQLFACYLSLVKGYNPDKPRGLTKITRISDSGM